MTDDVDEAAIAVRDALCAGPTGLHQVLARFIERARQAHRSVGLLADHGLAADAMAVCRTIVELAIDAAYILGDADQRAARLAKFEAFEDVTDAKFLAEFKDEEIVPTSTVVEVQERAASAKSDHEISTANNWDSDAKTRSKALTSLMGVETYATYRDGCRAGHSGPITLRYAFAADAKVQRHGMSGRQSLPSTAEDAWLLASTYLGALVLLIDEALGLGVPHGLPPFPWDHG